MFDPPHRAHIALAEAARQCLPSGTWLVLVPAARSPHKSSGPQASDEQRLEMLRRATAGLARIGIWTEELDRGKDGSPSYWVDTLHSARRQWPESAEIRFLIGADQAGQFHRWRKPDEILTLARPVVVLREPIDTTEKLAEALRESHVWSATQIKEWLGWVIDLPLARASSTDARSLLAAGDEAGARQLLDPAVLDFIQQQQLYSEPFTGR
jgi:nicotinate-nucleotide adenylyltransferase